MHLCSSVVSEYRSCALDKYLILYFYVSPVKKPEYEEEEIKKRCPSAYLLKSVKEGLLRRTPKCSLFYFTFQQMNSNFFQKIEAILSLERLAPYRQDNVDQYVVLARYLWNIDLCKSLYSPLQMAEVALRNSINLTLSTNIASDWYNQIQFPSDQQDQLNKVFVSLSSNKKTVTPGSVISELTFGFWTSFFNKYYAQQKLGALLCRQSFPHAPAAERNIKNLNVRWTHIRKLRNRVFHHERIIHWKDLTAQYQQLLDIIDWMSPELRKITSEINQFTDIFNKGIDPWLQWLRENGYALPQK